MTTKKINSLYELFNCSSKEELYLLVKEKNKKVQSLLNYIDYAKGDIGNKNAKINSPEALGKYVISTDLPKDNTATIIFANAKLQPLLLDRVKMNKKEDIINAIKRGLEAGATNTFLAIDSTAVIERDKKKIKEMLDTIDLKVVDIVHYNNYDKSLYSEKGDEKIYLTDENFDLYTDEHNLMNYSKKKEYTDFSSYYAKEKIKNLNILKDINEVKEILKVGYQHNVQEHFGYIAYNKDNNIVKVVELSKGGVNASIVDPRIFLRELMLIENIKGVAFYHNHPSGNPKPSDQDLNVTKMLTNVLENFNIEYFDHFIIGMENVFSFSDEVFGFESKNFKYQEICLSREKVEKHYLNKQAEKTPFQEYEQVKLSKEYGDDWELEP